MQSKICLRLDVGYEHPNIWSCWRNFATFHRFRLRIQLLTQHSLTDWEQAKQVFGSTVSTAWSTKTFYLFFWRAYPDNVWDLGSEIFVFWKSRSAPGWSISAFVWNWYSFWGWSFEWIPWIRWGWIYCHREASYPTCCFPIIWMFMYGAREANHFNVVVHQAALQNLVYYQGTLVSIRQVISGFEINSSEEQCWLTFPHPSLEESIMSHRSEHTYN